MHQRYPLRKQQLHQPLGCCLRRVMAAFVVSVSETSIHSFAHYLPDAEEAHHLNVCGN